MISYHTLNTLDYPPFGLRMSERSSNSSTYKYGFNGMEKDEEIKGEGNSYDFGARIYDPRIGRWLSLDPLAKKYPILSPYNYVANNPIKFVEYDGKDFGVYIDHSQNTILITANVYTINDKTQTEASEAASNWNALSGSTVLIGGVEYTVSVEIDSKMAEGSNDKDRFQNAHSSSNSDQIGNTYNGSTGGFKGEKKYGKLVTRHLTMTNAFKGLPIEAGVTDGKNITMPVWTTSLYDMYYAPRDKEFSVEHEMGHLFGLGDPNSNYYNDGGSMDYSGPYIPSQCDLENIIRYVLDSPPNGGAGQVKVKRNDQADKEEDYQILNSEDVGN